VGTVYDTAHCRTLACCSLLCRLNESVTDDDIVLRYSLRHWTSKIALESAQSPCHYQTTVPVVRT
jgi:hypothetical protein